MSPTQSGLPAPGLAQALARLAADKDQAAWTHLIALMGDPITGLLIRVTGDRSVAEDAVQETFLLLRDHAGAFRCDRSLGDIDSQARRWVMRVAVNTALKLLRSTKRLRGTERRAARQADDLAGDTTAPGDAMDRHEESALLRRELTLLPEIYAQALTFHFLAGQAFGELAHQLSIPQATARTRIHRGLKELRTRLLRRGLAFSIVGVSALLTELSVQQIGSTAAPATLSGLLASKGTATIAFAAPAGAGGAFFGGLTAAILVLGLSIPAVMLAATAIPAKIPVSPPMAVSPPGPSDGHVPAVDDTKTAIDKLIAVAIAHGFPDIRGATLFGGTLRVTSTSPDGWRQTLFGGVNAILPDGTYLIALAHRIKASTLEHDHDKLEWLGQKHLGPSVPGENLLIFSPGVSRTVRPRCHTAAMPDFPFLQLGDGGLADGGGLDGFGYEGAAFAALVRAGREELTNDSRDVLIAMAMRKSIFPGPMPLDLNRIGLLDGTMHDYRSDGPDYARLKDPTQVLAYALADWFASQLETNSAPFEHLAPQQALDGALALLPTDDTVARTLVIDRARAVGLTLAMAQHPDADETMALRLHDWRTEPDLDGVEAYEQQWAVDGRNANHNNANTLRCIDGGINSRFGQADLPALSIALSDQRLSGCGRYGRPYTIGDQALRAIVSVLGFDPRALIGRDPKAVWTSEESRKVAESLLPWLALHAQESLAQIRSEALPVLDWRTAAYLLKVIPLADAVPLFAQWAQQWRTHPPEDFDDAYLLMCGSTVPEFVKTTLAWPVTGRPGPLIATWQAQHGVTTGITTCIDDVLQTATGAQTREGIITGALMSFAFAPQPTVIQHLQDILSGDPTARPTRSLMAGCMVDCHFYSSSIWYFEQQGEPDKLDSVYAALAMQLLWDERPAPADLVALAQYRVDVAKALPDGPWPDMPMELDGPRQPGLTQTPGRSSDLRICDCAAVSEALTTYIMSHCDIKYEDRPTFDLGAALPRRDLQIRTIRTLLLTRMHALQTKLQVRVVIPGAPLPKDAKVIGEF